MKDSTDMIIAKNDKNSTKNDNIKSDVIKIELNKMVSNIGKIERDNKSNKNIIVNDITSKTNSNNKIEEISVIKVNKESKDSKKTINNIIDNNQEIKKTKLLTSETKLIEPTTEDSKSIQKCLFTKVYTIKKETKQNSVKIQEFQKQSKDNQTTTKLTFSSLNLFSNFSKSNSKHKMNSLESAKEKDSVKSSDKQKQIFDIKYNKNRFCNNIEEKDEAKDESKTANDRNNNGLMKFILNHEWFIYYYKRRANIGVINAYKNFCKENLEESPNDLIQIKLTEIDNNINNESDLKDYFNYINELINANFTTSTCFYKMSLISI